MGYDEFAKDLRFSCDQWMRSCAETEDRGITEIIVTKHRNGPVGTVKLLFEPQFTRFRNLAN